MDEKELVEKDSGSLNSSVEEKGKIVTQIITFSSGNKKTIKHIRTKTISQGEFTHFDLIDGGRIYINTKNVDFFEVFTENVNSKEDIKEKRGESNEDRKFNNYTNN